MFGGQGRRPAKEMDAEKEIDKLLEVLQLAIGNHNGVKYEEEVARCNEDPDAQNYFHGVFQYYDHLFDGPEKKEIMRNIANKRYAALKKALRQ